MPNGWVEISLFEICWLEDGNQIHGEELVYWDAKALRGKNTKVKISYGKIVEQGKNVILVDGENSGEVFTIPYRGYLGSTFKILQIAPLVSQNFVRIILDYNRDLFRENKTGSAIPHLNKRLFKTMNVLLPPFLEQERIAKNVDLLLSQIDIIEQNQTGIETLYDELKKCTLDLAIQGKLVPQDENDEPASVLLEKIRAEKKAKLGKKYVDSYIYKGDDNCYYEKVGNSEPVLLENVPFEMPDSWCWARLGNLGDWGAGATPSRANPVYYNGSIPWIKTGELNNGYVYSSEETITEKALQECSLRYNNIGDILIAMYGATIGKLGIAGVKLTTNQACCCCTPFDGLYNLYLFYLLMAEKDRFIKLGAGGAQPNISREKIVNFIVPLPPYNEQQRIVKRLKKMLEYFEKDEV